MRRRQARSSIALLALVAGCSAGEGGLGHPGVGAGPVKPLTLEFENFLDEDVYIDWPGILPAIEVKRDAVTLMTDRGCIPYCGEGCECSTCTTPSRVRRIPAHETLSITWEPVHFAANTCNGSAECSCVESWPVTAGHYNLLLSGFTQAEGGTPTADNPNVLIGAKPGPRSRTCTARGEFDLVGGATVETKFICP